MEYTITSTKWNGETSDEFVERFEGTPQEIAELLRLTVGMNEASFGKYEKDKTFKLDDIEEFKKGKIAVNCKTEQLAKVFIKRLYDMSIYWIADNRGRLSHETNWDKYKTDTTYACNFNTQIQYCSRNYYEGKVRQIKEFKGW